MVKFFSFIKTIKHYLIKIVYTVIDYNLYLPTFFSVPEVKDKIPYYYITDIDIEVGLSILYVHYTKDNTI